MSRIYDLRIDAKYSGLHTFGPLWLRFECTSQALNQSDTPPLLRPAFVVRHPSFLCPKAFISVVEDLTQGRFVRTAKYYWILKVSSTCRRETTGRCEVRSSSSARSCRTIVSSCSLALSAEPASIATNFWMAEVDMTEVIVTCILRWFQVGRNFCAISPYG